MKHSMSGRVRGFSLIELLVAMAIGLVVTLAVTSVLIRSESSKRSSTSLNDVNQTGAYAAYVLDRAIRSAGSGYSQRWSDVYGCLLDVSKNDGSHVLPIPATIAASSAFGKITNTSAPIPLRLAPFIIGKGMADKGADLRGDVLLVMAGTAGVGESPQSVSPGSVQPSTGPTEFQLLTNALGYRTKDLVLLSDTGVGGGCMMQQVGTRTASDFSPLVPLAGDYFQATGTNVNLGDFGASTIALQLGGADTNRPQFFAYAVGDNNTLFSYDLLNPLPTGGADNRPDTPIADGVVEMRALYGLDTTNPPDGVLDSWLDPDAGSGYEASVLTDGTAASRDKLRQIVAVRIGLILRTNLQEKAPATSASGVTADETFAGANADSRTLFAGVKNASATSLAYTRVATGSDLQYRYRPVEVVIPLRNVQLAPQK